MKPPPRKSPKKSLYLDDETHRELRAEARRLERPISWLAQKAWEIARPVLQKMPAVEVP